MQAFVESIFGMIDESLQVNFLHGNFHQEKSKGEKR